MIDKIYTHVNLDLDAASTAALLMLVYNKKVEDVIFVPADYTKKIGEKDIAVDIDLGGKGFKGEILKYPEVKVLSAFSTVLHKFANKEYNEAFKDFAVFLDTYDSAKNWYDYYGLDRETARSIPNIIDVFNGLREQYNFDQNLLRVWLKIMQGFYKSKLSFKIALKQAKRAKWIREDIAVITGKIKKQVLSILMSKGADYVLFEDANNMGIIRSHRTKVNLGNALKYNLPDWFHHLAGFISCWGSSKAPKDKPPDISLERLQDLVITLL